MYSVVVVMVVVVVEQDPESVDCATVSCHRILRRGQSTISESILFESGGRISKNGKPTFSGCLGLRDKEAFN